MSEIMMEPNELDMLKYVSESKDDLVCDILKSNSDYLLKIPQNMRKEVYILCAMLAYIHIFNSLEDNEKTTRICEIAVERIPYYMKDVPEKIKTEEFILRMVSKNGSVIKYIDNQTEEMCMRAVMSAPYAIRYIKNQTEEMKLIAIKNGDGTIFYVDNPTEEMMSLASNTKGLYKGRRNMPQYYNAVLLYMKKYGSSLKYIRRKFKTYEVCKAAIRSSPYAIRYVNKSTLRKHPDLLELSIEKWGK